MQNSTLYSILTSYQLDTLSRDTIIAGLIEKQMPKADLSNYYNIIRQSIFNIYENFLYLYGNGEITEQDFKQHETIILELGKDGGIWETGEENYTRIKQYLRNNA